MVPFMKLLQIVISKMKNIEIVPRNTFKDLFKALKQGR